MVLYPANSIKIHKSHFELTVFEVSDLVKKRKVNEKEIKITYIIVSH